MDMVGILVDSCTGRKEGERLQVSLVGVMPCEVFRPTPFGGVAKQSHMTYRLDKST